MLIGLRSRKHIPPFELERPASIKDACRILAAPGRTALMAGGLDLIDRLKTGEAVDRVVCLCCIDELRGIRREGNAVSIGALTTHAELAQDPVLAEAAPDLPAIWRTLANPRVRYVGTVGGNLMSAKPHYDAWPALLALGAEASALDHFGAETRVDLAALRDRASVILGGVRLTVAPFSVRLLADRSLHPQVSVYLGVSIAAGKVRAAKIAVGCAFARAEVVTLPVSDVSLAALGADAATLARQVVETLPDPAGNGVASAAYRRRMIEVLSRRLLIRLGAQ